MARGVAKVTTPRVVLVDQDPTFRLFLKNALESRPGVEVVGQAATGTDMVRTVLAMEPDIVVFSLQLPHLAGVDALRQIYQERTVGAVLLADAQEETLARKATEEFILSYALKPFHAHQLDAILFSLLARLNERRTLVQENTQLQQTLENRKIIERAKGELMRRYHWSEARAYRHLQRGAMNERTTMVQLAQEVLQGADSVPSRQPERRPAMPARGYTLPTEAEESATLG